MRAMLRSTAGLVLVVSACTSASQSGGNAGSGGSSGNSASSGGESSTGSPAAGSNASVTGTALGGAGNMSGGSTGGTTGGVGSGGTNSAGAPGGASSGGADGGSTAAGASGDGGTNSGGSADGADASTSEGGGAGAEMLGELRISSDTNSIEFTPALVAAEDFYPGTATVGTGGIAALLTDSTLDLGTNAETQTLRQSVEHPNVRIIFTVTETFYRIIASRQAGIATLADLEGKRVATIAGTSAAYYVDKMMNTVGLSDDDVTIVSGGTCNAAPCGANTIPGLLASGNADAATLWEPTARLAADAIGSDAIEFQDRSVYREMVNLHTTAEKLADPERRRAIVGFVRALIQAQELYRTQPAEVQPRVADAIGVELGLIEEVWQDEQFAGVLAPDLLDVLEVEEVWSAEQANRAVRTREELATFIDESVAAEALSDP